MPDPKVASINVVQFRAWPDGLLGQAAFGIWSASCDVRGGRRQAVLVPARFE